MSDIQNSKTLPDNLNVPNNATWNALYILIARKNKELVEIC